MITQQTARYYAEKYNARNPLIPIKFVKASIIELDGTKNGQQNGNTSNITNNKIMYGMEEYLEGTFIKHNSNTGFVNAEETNSAPQAFSHFSFQESDCKLLVWRHISLFSKISNGDVISRWLISKEWATRIQIRKFTLMMGRGLVWAIRVNQGLLISLIPIVAIRYFFF